MKISVGTNLKLHNNLKLFRERRRYTKSDMARRSYITREAYAKIEKGEANPSIMTALMIANSIGEEVDKVFYIKEEKVL